LQLCEDGTHCPGIGDPALSVPDQHPLAKPRAVCSLRCVRRGCCGLERSARTVHHDVNPRGDEPPRRIHENGIISNSKMQLVAAVQHEQRELPALNRGRFESRHRSWNLKFELGWEILF
jgi:hypothetical protein